MGVFEGGKIPGNWQTPLINVLTSYLTKLDLGEPVDLDELVDAAEGGLALAGDQVGADAEAVDGVALVDSIGSPRRGGGETFLDVLALGMEGLQRRLDGRRGRRPLPSSELHGNEVACGSEDSSVVKVEEYSR